MKPPCGRIDAVGVAALVVGATGIGLAPILVRLSEVGPVATAFYRLLLAQPIIWLLLKREAKAGPAVLSGPRAQEIPPNNRATITASEPPSNSPASLGGTDRSLGASIRTLNRPDLFLAALLAWWILHEPLPPLRAAGGFVIIVGILVGTCRAGD